MQIGSLRSFIKIQQLRELVLFLILCGLIYYFNSEVEEFMVARTFDRISVSVAVIAVLAVGQTLVVITRNVDLSVGSIAGLTAYYVGTQLMEDNTINVETAVLMAIAIGAALGLINGLITAYGGVPSIVVTLGTLAIYRAILVNYADSAAVEFRRLPEWAKFLRQKVMADGIGLELTYLPTLAIGTMLLFQLVLIYTNFGRRLYAIGSSPEAAEVAGIPARRIVTTAFVINGALAGLAGFMQLIARRTLNADVARGFELDAIAAVVVGGVNIFGGSGTVLGAMIGAIIFGTIEYGLRRMQVSQFRKDALLGVFVMGAVLIDTVVMGWLRSLLSQTELRRHDDVDKGSEAV